MANTIDFILTNSAKELIPKVLNGKTLKFTRMAIGDGFAYDTTVAKGFKNLVHEVLSLDITKKEVIDSATVKITSAFTNTDVNAEFYYREVGLFAQDPDTGQEVLYAYGNRNDAAELITPAGNNVVSKQLIFVINVGDSANVTFNVINGIYALQSDMVEVQTDINKAKTDVEVVKNNVATLQTNKADKNLVNTGMITNCLLEVSQHIKLELSNGVLTLKAGSKGYLTNGTEIITSTDLSTTNEHNGQLLVFIDSDKRMGLAFKGGTITSDPDLTINNHIYFNATSNKCLFVTNGAFKEVSLPLANITVSNGAISSIDQIFNGYGYIGSTIFELPGIKGLVTEGINDDGSLKTVIKTTTKVSIDSLSGIYSNSVISNLEGTVEDTVWLGEFDKPPSVEGILATPRYLNTRTNFMQIYLTDNNWGNQYGFLQVFENIEIDATGKILSITPKKPFRAVDYNDYQTKIAELEARLSALETI